jgi:hypothetical protein
MHELDYMMLRILDGPQGMESQTEKSVLQLLITAKI